MERDFVVVRDDGTLSVVSGKTGQVQVLENEELKTRILELIKQRQDAGEELRQLLRQYELSDAACIQIGVIGPKAAERLPE